MAITTNGGAGVTADAVVTLSNKTLAAPVITGGVGITGTTTITGDLTVTGTTTNINTTNLVIEDKNIILADVTTPTDVTADGGGITIKGATDKTLNWVDATDAFTSSEHINLASGKSYYVNGTLLKDVSETLTNKTLTTPVISSITNTGTLTLPTSTDTLVGRATTDTLTNKTLTSPVISSISNTGTLTLPTATGTVALTSDITITGSSKLSAFAATTSSELAGVISDETGTGALVFGTSPTIGTPAITGGTLKDAVIKGLEEDVNVVASAATGTINFDVDTASIWYYTTDATANHTLNFRYSSGASLDSVMTTGDAITLVWLNTNGATPYYPNVINIDGSAVTPKAPATISAGNASAIDAYSFTIIKTASATFTVLETQTKFA
jgi:hypothetical protein